MSPAPGQVLTHGRGFVSEGPVLRERAVECSEVLPREGAVMGSVLDDRVFGFGGLGTSLFMDVHQASSLPASCLEMLLVALGSIRIFSP